jgi:siroheme synthase-like protein
VPPVDDTSSLAIQLRVQDRRCVVVGGGAVAARRSLTLLAAGARVTVVAPWVMPEVERLAGDGMVQLERRRFQDTDLQPTESGPVLLVVAATDDPEVNRRVGGTAAVLGVLVNRADDGASGDVTFPATLRRGPVTVAVSSAGAAPVATGWVAERLDEQLDRVLGLDAAGLTMLVEVLAEVRRERPRPVRADEGPDPSGERGVTVDAVDWRSALDGSILELIHQGRRAEAKERLLACLSS